MKPFRFDNKGLEFIYLNSVFHTNHVIIRFLESLKGKMRLHQLYIVFSIASEIKFLTITAPEITLTQLIPRPGALE